MPHPFQWDIADTAGELNDAADGFRYPIVVVSVPRRGGKTLLTLAANLDRMDMLPDARCWYTANKRETAAKLFRDEWSPMLNRLGRLYRLRKSQGSEGVHKRRGSSSLQLFAPNADGLHSANADTVTIDEAWVFDIDQGEDIEAGVRPAQLTRPWRQTWIVSAGGTIESAWWDRWLTAGALPTPGVALFDYGADPADPAYDPGDPRVWAASHPAFGHTVTEAALAHEWATRDSDAAFERAYLNVWPRPSSVIAAAGLDLAQWAAARHPDVAPAPVAAIALDVSGDRSAASLAVAGRAADGTVVVEVVEARPGVQWVAAAVKRARAAHRGARVVADSLVAASIVAELTRAHVDVDPIGARAHAEACGTFVDLLAAGHLSHRGQLALDDAVAGAARRPLGDAWLWSRARSNVDISPLVAVTLAAGAAHARRTPGRAVVVAAGPTPQSGRSGPNFARGAANGPRGARRPHPTP